MDALVVNLVETEGCLRFGATHTTLTLLKLHDWSLLLVVFQCSMSNHHSGLVNVMGCLLLDHLH